MFLSSALKDLFSGMMLFRYWLYAAFLRLQLEHKKTVFSLLWEPITVFFVAAVLSLVWSEILGVGDPVDYFFYILIGFSVWSLLFAKLINRAVASLSNRSGELQNAYRPICVLFFEDIAYSFFNFSLAFPFILIACVWHFGMTVQLFGMFVLGLVLVWVTAVGLCLTLGVLTFFVRDVLHITKAVMRLGFLITPIIWKPERLGDFADLVWINPFYSYLDLLRSPLMGVWPHDNSLWIATILSLCLSVVGVLILQFSGANIRRGVFKS